MWRDITITHCRSKKVETVPCGTIDINFGNDIAMIRSYYSVQGAGTSSNYVLGSPSLIKLNSNEMEFNAIYLSTKFGPKGGMKTSKHKVNVKAKF